MKDYIDQFYNEGLATTFYLKPVRFIEKSIRNKRIVNFIKILIKIVYTLLVLIFAWFVFWSKYPL